MMRFVLSAGVLAALVGSAHAAPKCPSGQIYRVTKKVCVDKALAIQQGIISSRQTNTESRKARGAAKQTLEQDRKPSQAASVSTASTDKSASSADKSKAPEIAQTSRVNGTDAPRTIILSPVKNVLGWSRSPFGALVDPWTSDTFSATPEARFSLKLATED